MSAIDIFKKIKEHQVSGVMLHKNMMQYYDFLGFHGLKRLHEYHMFKELMANDIVERYAINHLNRIIVEGHIPAPFKVPENWANVDRLAVKNEYRRQYLQDGMKKWHEWELLTKDTYQGLYKELCDMGEVAAAQVVLRLVEDVDKELKYTQRLFIKFTKMDWDLKSIEPFEKPMHDKFAKKTRKLKFEIC